MKIFDSERKIMEELWDRGELRASELVQILHDKTGCGLLKKDNLQGNLQKEKLH